jgi:hypothetical protein
MSIEVTVAVVAEIVEIKLCNHEWLIKIVRYNSKIQPRNWEVQNPINRDSNTLTLGEA